jgi:hypothetical protein
MCNSLFTRVCFCISITFFQASSSVAEEVWVYLGKVNNAGDFYAAVNSRIMGVGGFDYIVRMWIKNNLPYIGSAINGSGQIMPFGSAIMLGEYNCRDGETRSLKRIIYSEIDGKGKVVGETGVAQWHPVEPGTPGEKWWKVACDK